MYCKGNNNMKKLFLVFILSSCANLLSSDAPSSSVQLELNNMRSELNTIRTAGETITPEKLAELNLALNGIFVAIPSSPDKNERQHFFSEAAAVNRALTELLGRPIQKQPQITISEE